MSHNVILSLNVILSMPLEANSSILQLYSWSPHMPLPIWNFSPDVIPNSWMSHGQMIEELTFHYLSQWKIAMPTKTHLKTMLCRVSMSACPKPSVTTAPCALSQKPFHGIVRGLSWRSKGNVLWKGIWGWMREVIGEYMGVVLGRWLGEEDVRQWWEWTSGQGKDAD